MEDLFSEDFTLPVPVNMGISGFDSLVEGGVLSGTSLILQGSGGNEKEFIGAAFINQGILDDEDIFITLSMISPQEYVVNMRRLGYNIQKSVKEGHFKIIDWYSHKIARVENIEEGPSVIRVSKNITNLEIAINRVLKYFDERKPKNRIRAYLDFLSPALKLFDFDTVYKLSQTIRAKLKEQGVTALLPVESTMHDEKILSSLQMVFDGVVNVERVQIAPFLFETRIAILSLTGAYFDPSYHKLEITRNGLFIKAMTHIPPPPTTTPSRIETPATTPLPPPIASAAGPQSHNIQSPPPPAIIQNGIDFAGSDKTDRTRGDAISPEKLPTSAPGTQFVQAISGSTINLREEVSPLSELHKGVMTDSITEKAASTQLPSANTGTDIINTQPSVFSEATGMKKDHILSHPSSEIPVPLTPIPPPPPPDNVVKDSPEKGEERKIITESEVEDRKEEEEEEKEEKKQDIEREKEGEKETDVSKEKTADKVAAGEGEGGEGSGDEGLSIPEIRAALYKYEQEGYSTTYVNMSLNQGPEVARKAYLTFRDYVRKMEELKMELSKLDVRGFEKEVDSLIIKTKDFFLMPQVFTEFETLKSKIKIKKAKEIRERLLARKAALKRPEDTRTVESVSPAHIAEKPEDKTPISENVVSSSPPSLSSSQPVPKHPQVSPQQDTESSPTPSNPSPPALPQVAAGKEKEKEKESPVSLTTDKQPAE
ncbi:MAG: ATPase domain-containing protein, partial [Thermoplasmata archaeon]